MTRLRSVPLTETQVLKNRYDEARAIKEAWDWRLKRAQLELRDATTHNRDVKPAAMNLAAVEIQVTDAAGELEVALTNWVHHNAAINNTTIHVVTHPDLAKQIDLAAELFNDGASQTEVHRTTGLARETLRKYFPGQGWTQKEGGDFRALTKAADHHINRRTA